MALPGAPSRRRGDARRPRDARGGRHGPRPGVEALTFAVFAKVFAVTEGFLPEDPRLARAFRVVTLETGLVASAVLLLAGAGLCASVVADWAASVFNYLDYSVSMRRMIPGALLLVLGAHGLLASFFLSILGLKRR